MIARRAVIIALLFLAPGLLSAAEFTSEMRQAAQTHPELYTFAPGTIRAENCDPQGTKNCDPEKTFTAPKPAQDAQPKESVNPVVMIGEIVNLGAKIWNIIKENKPTDDIKTLYATATPDGVTQWNRLQGWTPPQGPVYGFSAKNKLGREVVAVRYQVLRSYNGSYNNQGRYLTAVTVQPVHVEIGWGYDFQLSVEIPDKGLLNAGSVENPVAGMQVIVKWTISTPLQIGRASCRERVCQYV